MSRPRPPGAAIASLRPRPWLNFTGSTPAKVLLVDTRQDWEYRSGHIQGAVNFPLEPTAWSRWRSQGRLAALLGPDQDRLVVFY